VNQALLAKGAIKEQKVKSDDLVTVEQKVKPAQKERERGAKKVKRVFKVLREAAAKTTS